MHFLLKIKNRIKKGQGTGDRLLACTLDTPLWRCPNDLLSYPYLFFLFWNIIRIGASGSSFPVEFKDGYDRMSNFHSLSSQWGMYDAILNI